MAHKHKKVPPQEISRCAVIKFQLKKWWKPMFSILVPAVCSLIFMWHPELKDNDDKLQPIPVKVFFKNDIPKNLYNFLVTR